MSEVLAAASTPAVITAAIAVHEVRISRKCPACFKRAMQRGNFDGRKHSIRCVLCGHVWNGVVKEAEKRA